VTLPPIGGMQRGSVRRGELDFWEAASRTVGRPSAFSQGTSRGSNQARRSTSHAALML
jgi:hypothetical protein